MIVRLLSIALLTAALGIPAVASAEPPEKLPPTVPGVQDWAPGGGRFELGGSARIIPSAELEPVARQLAADLARGGRGVPAVEMGAAARPGDLILRIDPSAPERPESYRIDIGTTLSAVARTRAGAVFATQTMLQWLRQSSTLPGGAVQDWPNYPERGLMLDTGREFFTVDWVKQRIREVAYYRMNFLHLHLSDTGGFRLQSEQHPEITAPQHYSKDDIREIVSYADQFGVDLIPEIGFPGHMNGILAAHPELKLMPASTSATDAVTDQLLAGSLDGRMDLSKPDAYRLTEDILREFIPLFPGRYFHIGGDEYVSDFARFPQLGVYAKEALGPEFGAEDVPASFFNWANGIVRSYGKTTRMWNDGMSHTGRVGIDPSIIAEYWTFGTVPWVGPGKTPDQLIDEGRPIQNAAFTPTYFATGGYATPLNAPPELLYAWDPGVFVNGQRVRPENQYRVTGSKLHIWCDDPTAMTPEQIVGPLRARLPIMAQQLWSGTEGTPYPAFVGAVQSAGLP